MRKYGMQLLVLCVIVAACSSPVPAFESDKASECVEIAEKAAAFAHEKGKDYALRVFSVSKGPFIDRELYVFACSMGNVMLAHPYSRDLIGRNVTDFQDSRGKAIFQEFRKIAQERGSGWVEYYWKRPGEEGEFRKSTYIKRIAALDLYVGVGYYK